MHIKSYFIAGIHLIVFTGARIIVAPLTDLRFAMEVGEDNELDEVLPKSPGLFEDVLPNSPI